MTTPSPFPSPSRGEGCVRNLQSSVDLVLAQTGDAEHFAAGAGAFENFDVRLGRIKEVGQEFEAGGVGRTLHRRRRQQNIQGVSGPADDRVARGPWLDADGNGDVRFGSPLTGCG